MASRNFFLTNIVVEYILFAAYKYVEGTSKYNKFNEFKYSFPNKIRMNFPNKNISKIHIVDIIKASFNPLFLFFISFS